jgi:hypothetical protein
MATETLVVEYQNDLVPRGIDTLIAETLQVSGPNKHSFSVTSYRVSNLLKKRNFHLHPGFVISFILTLKWLMN